MTKASKKFGGQIKIVQETYKGEIIVYTNTNFVQKYWEMLEGSDFGEVVREQKMITEI